MTTALIADDEEAPRQQLRAALAAAWPGLEIVAEAGNGIDAWDLFLAHEPEVCFLDVRMPGLTGIDVARRIDGAARIVFVTAYGDHALAAFDAGAVDYLMKPVEPERLARTVAKLQAGPAAPVPAGLEPAMLADLLRRLGAPARAEPPLEVIQAAVGKEVRLIPVDEVVFFESDTRYTRVVHRGGEALIRTPLKELLVRLPPERFWQVHRSIIVNQRAIASAVRQDDGSMLVMLRDRDERLPVSRHFQSLFRGQ
ncbi:MAG: LytTR family DNA-binding domain-containing protein [Burkholderiales bacterium]|nr:LytTR family DNA-binding domain-containing protein [Burkholderiales bacterium]